MSKAIRPQPYPRIEDEDDNYYGYLNESVLKAHTNKISKEALREIIIDAIEYANAKSSRNLLELPDGLPEPVLHLLLKTKGKSLFTYFVKYCGDPASTAYECLGKSYMQIARNNFQNRTLQMERMNAGWRYQHLAKDTAKLSERFSSVSDLNSIEADFSAIIGYADNSGRVNIYVSVKNRSNTMGGQDWPKAIAALENAASNDKNRAGPYICVFGIAMEKGLRNIKTQRDSKKPYSNNTEVWNSQFFWPFFSNYSYEEIVTAVLDVLNEKKELSSLDVEIPDQLIESFGDECRKLNLIDDQGRFNDANRLVKLFCGTL